MLADQAPKWDLKVARLAYWIWLVVVVVFVVPLAISQTRPGESWYDTLVVNILGVMVFALPALLLRWYIKARYRRVVAEVE